MKKFIALGAAAIVLLFSFAASTEVAAVDDGGVMVCEDLPLDPHPYN